MLTLKCLCQGLTFEIHIDPDETVENLVRLIKNQEVEYFKNIPLDEFTLHSVDIPSGDNGLLQQFEEQDKLAKETMKMKPNDKVSEYFQDGEVDVSAISIIIEVPIVSVYFSFLMRKKKTPPCLFIFS